MSREELSAYVKVLEALSFERAHLNDARAILDHQPAPQSAPDPDAPQDPAAGGPRTAAGRALHKSLRRGVTFVEAWDSLGQSCPDHALPAILAIEAEAAAVPPPAPLDGYNRLRRAIVTMDPKQAGPYTISDLARFTEALYARLAGEREP